MLQPAKGCTNQRIINPQITLTALAHCETKAMHDNMGILLRGINNQKENFLKNILRRNFLVYTAISKRVFTSRLVWSLRL